jgi:hypothetical protein
MNHLRGFFFLRKSADEMPSSDWITFDEIERLLRKRKIDKNWLVRRGGDNEWVTIQALMKDALRRDGSMPNTPVVSFACIRCLVALRIQLRFELTLYRCPKCGMNYQSVQSSGETPVFLMIPTEAGAPNGNVGSVQRSRNELPSEVKGALTILNLEAAASFDAVRQAYRQMIKSYHPDKVAHLGPDLQKLAEVKTKMINASFMILENFFSKSDGQKA